MIKDRLDKTELYSKAIPCWKSIEKVISSEDLEVIKQGRYELQDGCFYIKTEYETNVFRKDNFEFHKKYIDIQIVLEGEELIYCSPLSRIKPDSNGYDDEKDIQFGSATDWDILRLKKGDMAVLYPEDGHCPACRTGESADHVIKVVIKVPVRQP